MRLISWNCRGLANPLKAEVVKDLLKVESPEILMIQDTKIEGKTLLKINKIKWKKNVGKAISARASSSSLTTLWSDDKFHLESSYETQRWIFNELRHFSSKLSFSLFNLYVHVLYFEKKDC